MSNRARAQAARDALSVFTTRVFGGRTPEELGAHSVEFALASGLHGVDPDSDADTMVADFLCNLRHYCDAVGIDWDAQVGRADLHFLAERGNPWDEDE